MKKEKKITPFFRKLTATWFEFFEKKFGLRPSFTGSAPRDLKLIVDEMQQRSEEQQIEWTEFFAVGILEVFLETAYNDPWLRENFLLSNLNRQKDKIFVRMKKQINGSATTKNEQLREDVNSEFNRRYSK